MRTGMPFAGYRFSNAKVLFSFKESALPVEPEGF